MRSKCGLLRRCINQTAFSFAACLALIERHDQRAGLATAKANRGGIFGDVLLIFQKELIGIGYEC